MPKVILSYKKDLIKEYELGNIGRDIRELVAEAASTAESKLSRSDVDFLFFENDYRWQVPDIGIEIETIGFPARRRKLGRDDVILKLKSDILAIPGFPKIDPTLPLIWIKLWDPTGPHI